MTICLFAAYIYAPELDIYSGYILHMIDKNLNQKVLNVNQNCPYPLFFSSPESVVVVRKLVTFSTSSPEPLDGF